MPVTRHQGAAATPRSVARDAQGAAPKGSLPGCNWGSVGSFDATKQAKKKEWFEMV